jgi:hypothetical protein
LFACVLREVRALSENDKHDAAHGGAKQSKKVFLTRKSSISHQAKRRKEEKT